ncbi:MAG TPA: hypothetical protein EYQ43_02160 [Methyloprofundus sp.]|uniref:hypothetical protein n=1 Tax=Methyloprofundus sp. TaxID=2020875 RepID=UPI0017EEE301|nr:hypothetical protein [Methyloprofundus sp.]HIG64377.1 hypothetical protein [Methyloprofundus sp.]HIL79054.1 hypothetical protein [Methylococcales bacterium]
MKTVLLVSLILPLVITLTACDDSTNTDQGTEVSAQLKETGATETEQVSQPAQGVISDTAEVIEDNLESIQENLENNP